jgi:hypothetical protein
MNIRRSSAVIFFISVLQMGGFSRIVCAQTGPPTADSGRITFGLQLAYGLEDAIPRDISHINLLYVQPQIGYALWHSPHARGPLQRFEIATEGVAGGSPHPGGRLFGDTLMFRWTFKSIGAFTPYVNAGSGPTNTTIDRHASELGGNVQFLNSGGGGVMHRLSENTAWVVEWRYFHMSNAGLYEPNHGFNGNIIAVGARWFTKARLPR